MHEKLLEIGLTDHEARVYLELLAIGTQVAGVLAKRVKIHRTTVYSVLKNLEVKGLISSRMKLKVRFFSANDPNCLIGYLDRQSRVYADYRTDMLKLIPDFRLLMKKYEFKKPIVSYFEGLEGIKHVMYDALNAQGDFFAYLSLDKWFNSGLKNFLRDFKDFRILEKQKSLKVIVPSLPEIRNFFSENAEKYPPEMTEVLYACDEKFAALFENEMTIYDNKVNILHLKAGEEYGIVIENKAIASMEKKIFEMAWRGFGGIW